MNTIPAQVIKQRGISAVDEQLKTGPVHVITRNEPRYVVMDEQQYRDLVEIHNEAYYARVRAALKDVTAGNVLTFRSTAELMAAIHEYDDEGDDEQ